MPLRIQHHTTLPCEQGSEGFPRPFAPTTATVRHGFSSEVAFANHLHLRGGGQHFQAALAHHGIEQFQTWVGREFEKCFIDDGERDLRACRQRSAVRTLHFDVHLRLLAHCVGCALWGDAHVQAMWFPTDTNSRCTESVGRLVQIDKCSDFLRFRGVVLWQLFARHAATHCEHGNKHIWRITGLDRHVDYRRAATEGSNKALDHTFSFYGDQRGGAAKGHAYLEARGLAHFIFRLLGQHIHTIARGAAKPPVIFAGDPDGCVRASNVTTVIPCFGAHNDFATHARRYVANQ